MDDSLLFSLKLSVQVATVATMFVVIVGLSAAYVLSRKDFLGKDLLDILLTLPLVLPRQSRVITSSSSSAGTGF